MTRDGTFLIENGALAGGLTNFRFTQGILPALAKVSGLAAVEHGGRDEAADCLREVRHLGGATLNARMDSHRLSVQLDRCTIEA